MIILGINAYHGDSSACLIKEGHLICAIEEERLRRIKHWAGFPSESIKWCLSYAGISPEEVDHIAISRNPLSKLTKKALRVICKKPNFSFLCNRFANYEKILDIKRSYAEAFNLKSGSLKTKVRKVEHHRAHLASSFFVSPFERSALLSIDGFGDFVSALTGIGKNNKIKVFDDVEFPHSLGIFYTALTQFLGFWNYGDEYKVMGLSAFGKPLYLDKMRKIVKLRSNGLFALDISYFMHEKENVEMTWLSESPRLGRLFSDKLVSLLGEQRKEGEELDKRFQDIAASLQLMYEEVFFHILNHLYKKTKSENLALSGGCAQNSLANGKIYENTPFKNVYVPPAGHDAGGAIGAALYLWNQLLGNQRKFIMENAYWGPDFSREEIRNLLEENKIRYQEFQDEELFKKTAEHIAAGKIVGWFQGRTEWGPRALGNRSILVDPRRKEMKDTLNARIKKREWFRPFAPSILVERVSQWFEDGHAVPFMEKVYAIKPGKRELIPAVTHIDGTGRLQTVDHKTNPRYYNLIKKFEELTDVPIILNTSFNENEPIVNTPQDALNCFLKTKMDVLILGSYVVNRA